MTKSYCPFKQPEVISVFPPSNELLQIPHQSPLKQLLIYCLDHDAGPCSVQVTPFSLWQVIHPQVVSNIMKNPSNRCECAITKLVKFIRVHQPISLKLILIDDTLRVFVCSVWCQFRDARSKSLRLGDVKSKITSCSKLESFFWTKRSSRSSISRRLSLGKSPSLNLCND
ncbi:hypothetical protein Tco_1123927 [Tanacetum coccineum]|uniref:Uncharacterized protein n=1 Tax=Tanacetum coccineum TaxID=301880 RepID=A0ABQ5J4N4_9ASTR